LNTESIQYAHGLDADGWFDPYKEAPNSNAPHKPVAVYLGGSYLAILRFKTDESSEKK
jgi:hypothetical protein